MKHKIHKKMPVVYLLSLGYLITIIIGTFLLMLPIACKGDNGTALIDALLTSTSATCVTGLVPFDTFTHWSVFGQIVILILIQVGGLGFMTIITLIFMALKKNIGLYNRTIMMQSAGSYNISSITILIKRIMIGTLIFEGSGALLLAIGFWPTYGIKAIYYGIFHSVSAFCNAGFDITGSGSLTMFSNNWLVLTTIMLLIIIGGSGFVVWSDIVDNKFNFKKYQMHSKIVIVYNLLLIIIPTILFYLFEFTNIGFKATYNLSQSSSILNALFLAVSPRTAGFNALDLNLLSSPGKFLTIVLMFIGGNSGSTAGGLKVTTFVIVMASLLATAKSKKNIVFFKRKLPDSIIRQASSLLIAYMTLTIIATFVICIFEAQFSIDNILFEVVSAVGTVGLSIGLTQASSIITKVILILLMYAGRLGALTLFNLLVRKQNDIYISNPEGKVLVG